jgi:hypothetical protein
MVGADNIVLSVVLISSIQNLLFDLFFEVLLEYGVVFTRQYLPDFSIPGFGGFDQTSAAAESAGFAGLIEQLAATPQVIDKLSVEQLELLNTLLVSMQSAG